jgi:imidazolonepropionase-like amidohydrolase
LPTTILKGGPIIDVEGSRTWHRQMLVLEHGHIRSLESESELPHETDAAIIDVNGATILPGLIDSHFHLMSRSAVDADADLITTSTIDGVITARRAIESGITTVRDPGCKHRGIYTLRREIASGRVVGPRTFAAGPNVTGSGAPVDWRNVFADGVDEVRRVVRKERLAGADFIKLVLSHTTGSSKWRTCIRFMTDEEIDAAVSEAHMLGARTACHCEGLDAARAAVVAGMDVIDHGLSLDDEIVGLMIDRNTFYVPTLWAFATETHLNYGRTIRPDQVPDYDANIGQRHRESVQRAMAAGLTIAAGSDPIHWIPARDILLRELEALVEVGMTNMEALRAATINGAKVIGAEDRIGSIAPGKAADVLVVVGDPLVDLRALARPLLVMKDGLALVDFLGDSVSATRHWSEIATGQPASARQPEIWLERA